MPGNPRRIPHGSSIPPRSPYIMGSFVDGSVIRGILLDGIPEIPGGDVGGPSVPHHL